MLEKRQEEDLGTHMVCSCFFHPIIAIVVTFIFYCCSPKAFPLLSTGMLPYTDLAQSYPIWCFAKIDMFAFFGADRMPHLKMHV